MTLTGDDPKMRRPAPWHRAMWGGLVALFLLPAVAMRFTSEVKWTAFDFAVFAALLFGGGLAYELVARRLRKPVHRLVAGAAVAGVVLLLWAQGAVGIL
jgi:hypothetical protein